MYVYGITYYSKKYKFDINKKYLLEVKKYLEVTLSFVTILI